MRILLILLLFAVPLTAQEKLYKKGFVTDSLRVSDTADESYALYLPLNFDGRTGLPVIFVFDGEGRGKPAARLFQPAAEHQGYIIVSSNNIARDKSQEENLMAAVRLVQDITKTLPIDLNSISYAGFAEGAEVATSLPLIINHTHGVIYVGSQLFNLSNTEGKEKFVTVGIVGNKQVNLGNMEIGSMQLRSKGYPGSLYTFDGGLEWPSSEIIASAVGSLTLEGVKSKERPFDQPLLEELYQQDLKLAEGFISSGNYLLAQSYLENISEKYRGVLKTGEVKGKLNDLRKSKGFKAQNRDLQKVREKEARLWNDFIYYFNQDIATANFANLGWWNYQKMELQKLAEGEDKAEAAMALRLIDLLERLSEEKLVEVEREDLPLESRLLAYMLTTVFDQQNFDAYKKIISLSTMDNDYSTALFYLEEMLKNGYKDLESLYEIEGTLGLKLSREFNWIIKKYLGTSRYFENATSLH